MSYERDAITTAERKNVIALKGQQNFFGERNHPDVDAIEEHEAPSGDEVVTLQNKYKQEQSQDDEGHDNKLSTEEEGEEDLPAVLVTAIITEGDQDGENETTEEQHPVRPDLAAAKERGEDIQAAMDTIESADDAMRKRSNPADATGGNKNGKESGHRQEEKRVASQAEAEIEESPSPLAAEAKGESQRSNHRRKAEEKRGGRRCSKEGSLSSLRRWLGIAKSRHEVGDLVEAEWDGSGSLFVGYVAAVGNGKDRSVHHVVFADGDEMDVQGRFLRQLGPLGHPKGSAGTLARHVPVLDLGSGRLHRNIEPKNLTGDDDDGEYYTGKKGKRPRRMKNMKTRSSQKNENDNSSSNSRSFRETSSSQAVVEESGSPNAERKDLAVLRGRGSVGDISQRRKQGHNAVWGGRMPPSPGGSSSEIAAAEMSESMSASLRENFRWWETGTQYTFQPSLNPRLTMKPSGWSALSDHVRKRGIPESCGRGRSGQRKTRSYDKVTTDGGSDLDRGVGEAGRDDGFIEEAAVILVVQPAEGNPDRGKRVYFVL